MALDLTYGAVRGLIAQEKLGWEPAPSIPDYVRLPHYAIGLDDAELVPTQDVPNFDFKALQLPTNPQIAIRRAERGIIEARDLERSFPTHLLQMLRSRTLPEAVLRSRDGADGPDVGSSRVATAVDWRNRWGANWITTVRDQNPCSACWAFAGTALIEAMLRIETGFWTRLSEGDVHRGVGKTCPNFGNSTEVSRFFARNGLCDPGSWPFMTTSPPLRSDA